MSGDAVFRSTVSHLLALTRQLLEMELDETQRDCASQVHECALRLRALDDARPPAPERAAIAEAKPSAPPGNAGTTTDARAGPRLLLVEDNPTNQVVARGLLRRIGYPNVDVADNGREALAALARQRYALVLMDGRMPVMDGFETARRIRAGDDGVLDPGVPIIAMTALAMSSDRARFLEAGMNGYLTKPVQAQELAAAIAALLTPGADPSGSAGDQRVPGTPAPPALLVRAPPVPEDPGIPDELPLLDESALLDGVMGDRAFAQVVIAQFLKDVPQRLVALRTALWKQDLEQVGLMAHSLKGLAGHLAARRLHALALRLERLVQQNETAAVGVLAGQLDLEYARLRPILEAWLPTDEGSGFVTPTQ